MKRKPVLFIHLFAILHAVSSFACRYFGLMDELILTLLSMIMVVLISFRFRRGIVFLLSSVLAVNVLGYFLGSVLSKAFFALGGEALSVYPLSTLLCTEILGWGIFFAARLFSRNGKASVGEETSGVILMLIAFIAILVVRLLFVIFNAPHADVHTMQINMVVDYVFSCIAVFIVAEYAVRASHAAHLAQYRYDKLKQMVNPHFLFNSLNILDYMIVERNPKDASVYTHKLADVYRYMLRSEDVYRVSLREEMEFVQAYIDLIMVRFPEGLRIDVDIPAGSLSQHVVPCSVQLLIENAIKHNAVLPSKPLELSITATDSCVSVSNTIQPKVGHSTESMGIGLKYIEQQYHDSFARKIRIEQTSSRYTVILPLIQ